MSIYRTQIDINAETARFREGFCSDQFNSIESAFWTFYTNLRRDYTFGQRLYLPVNWTMLDRPGKYMSQLREELKCFLSSLDPHVGYFTVSNNAITQDIYDLLPVDTLIYTGDARQKRHGEISMFPYLTLPSLTHKSMVNRSIHNIRCPKKPISFVLSMEENVDTALKHATDKDRQTLIDCLIYAKEHDIIYHPIGGPHNWEHQTAATNGACFVIVPGGVLYYQSDMRLIHILCHVDPYVIPVLYNASRLDAFFISEDIDTTCNDLRDVFPCYNDISVEELVAALNAMSIDQAFKWLQRINIFRERICGQKAVCSRIQQHLVSEIPDTRRKQQKVLSASISGNSPSYYQGIIYGAPSWKEHGKDWDLWIYVDREVPDDVVAEFRRIGAHVQEMGCGDAKHNWGPTFWRHLPLFDSRVSKYVALESEFGIGAWLFTTIEAWEQSNQILLNYGPGGNEWFNAGETGIDKRDIDWIPLYDHSHVPAVSTYGSDEVRLNDIINKTLQEPLKHVYRGLTHHNIFMVRPNNPVIDIEPVKDVPAWFSRYENLYDYAPCSLHHSAEINYFRHISINDTQTETTN